MLSTDFAGDADEDFADVADSRPGVGAFRLVAGRTGNGVAGKRPAVVLVVAVRSFVRDNVGVATAAPASRAWKRRNLRTTC